MPTLTAAPCPGHELLATCRAHPHGLSAPCLDIHSGLLPVVFLDFSVQEKPSLRPLEKETFSLHSCPPLFSDLRHFPPSTAYFSPFLALPSFARPALSVPRGPSFDLLSLQAFGDCLFRPGLFWCAAAAGEGVRSKIGRAGWAPLPSCHSPLSSGRAAWAPKLFPRLSPTGERSVTGRLQLISDG